MWCLFAVSFGSVWAVPQSQLRSRGERKLNVVWHRDRFCRRRYSWAALTASNPSGVLVGSATTDSHGQYRVEALAPGRYRIEAQAVSKSSRSPSRSQLTTSRGLTTLRVGSASQTVNVQASPAAPDTSSAEENHALNPAVSQPLSRFELTTDDGEHLTSTDGQHGFVNNGSLKRNQCGESFIERLISSSPHKCGASTTSIFVFGY